VPADADRPALEARAAAGDAAARVALGLALLAEESDEATERGARLLEAASEGAFLTTFDAVRAAMASGELVPMVLRDVPADGAPEFPFAVENRRLFFPEASREELQAAQARSPEAAYDLGILLFFLDDPGYAPPPAGEGIGARLAERNFDAAARKGLGVASWAQGCLAMTMPGFKSTREAIDHFRAAHRRGHPLAADALAWIDRWRRLEIDAL
jgi:TPR repeat protein